MSSNLAALLELLLVFGVVLVWALREWWVNRRWLKERRKADPPA